MKSGRGSAVAALAFLSVVWGYNWVLMKEALRYSDPFDFAAWRTAIGAATLFAILGAQGRLRRPPHLRRIAVLGLTQIAIFTAITMLALVAGDPGKVSVLVYTMPVWAMFFAWRLLDQRPRRAHLVATGAALLGITCMAQPWRIESTPWSAIFALGGAAAWGFSSAYAARLRQAGLDALSVTAWSMGFGGALLVLVAWSLPSPPIRWDLYFALILLYNAVAAMALAWLLWSYVLERLPIMAASLGVLAVPLVGSVSSAIQLGERFSTIEIVGMGIVLASVSAMHWRAGNPSSPGSPR